MNSIESLLQSGSEQLQRAEIDSPDLVAQVWLAHLCDISRAQLLTFPERVLNEDQVIQYQQGIDQLTHHLPLPYLTGKTEFYQLSFQVNQHVLIPRPETEHLIDTALEYLQGSREKMKAADVGTGSGCIAVTLAVHSPHLQVAASDVSEQALVTARTNAELHDVADRITFRKGSLLEPLALEAPFDLIAANLPYVTREEWDKLPLSVKHYEPAIALVGGEDGLIYIDRLLRQIKQYTRKESLVLLEFGWQQAEAVRELARQHLPQAETEIRQDLAGKDRFAIIQLR